MNITYYIPDWDDRVDPGFDFVQEHYSTKGVSPYQRDSYAHELFSQPAYDGILVSIATLQGNQTKFKTIQEMGSIHRYLRLSQHSNRVLGDCGAFTYWQQDVPPYKTEEVLDIYQALRLDIGVSIDHLIFTADSAERTRRWQITHENAKAFLHAHRVGGYQFVPCGVAQGWDAESYQRAARELIRMGYEYIAIGGLVRSKTEEILTILSAVQEVVPSGIQIHLFGVNRPDFITKFVDRGITSFDSASRLRRAWMDDRENYYLADTAFCAIRVPHANLEAKKLEIPVGSLQRQEAEALRALRAYGQYSCSLEETLAVIMIYNDALIDARVAVQQRDEQIPIENALEKRQRLHARRLDLYHQTLSTRPWEQCTCEICRSIGIDVVIFRGNNRNRRRGFHNTWQLYRQIEALRAQSSTFTQLPLFS